MPTGKRRSRGKFSTGRSTSATPPPQEKPPQEEPQDPKSEKQEAEKESNDNNTKEDGADKQAAPPAAETTTTNTANPPICDLVLTSEKRRGVYECDYCHSDISQLPRIRCAVCLDFDLCLDCFATTDHGAAVARLKAAATAHSELAADGIASTMVAGISAAAANHRDTHGYRVCDSTRFPIFASTRSVLKTKEPPTPTPSSTKSEDGTTDEASSSKDDSKMAVDEDDDKKSAVDSETTKSEITSVVDRYVMTDDPKSIWTAEEDLRLLDAIKTHGLGNWGDIAEAVGGNGSVGKTPRRCMERYFDDFLGRYGHILPPYTIVDDTGDDNNDNNDDNNNNAMSEGGGDDEAVRASKRRHALMMRSSSNVSVASSMGGRSRKRFKVIPTESLPEYDSLWPNPYMPPIPGAKLGQEVARDLSSKAELAFVKAISAAPSKEEAEKIRKEYIETKMNQIGSPTVLPPRPEDSEVLPGADLVGFMPRRGDFDIEFENEAESALADMEFLQGDSPQDKELKVQVLEIYYQKQEEREKRKKFILSRNLFDYRKHVKKEEELPQDERDLIHRMRLFERFHTPEEHKQFIHDIIKAKKLRKEIAKLQMYRRIGIRSLAEAEMYELDKKRRQFHKEAQLQKEAMAKAATIPKVASSAAAAAGTPGAATPQAATEKEAAASAPPPSTVAKESLWKQYRTNDRKIRRSINRAGSGAAEDKSDKKEDKSDSKEEKPDKQEDKTDTQDEQSEKKDDDQKDEKSANTGETQEKSDAKEGAADKEAAAGDKVKSEASKETEGENKPSEKKDEDTEAAKEDDKPSKDDTKSEEGKPDDTVSAKDEKKELDVKDDDKMDVDAKDEKKDVDADEDKMDVDEKEDDEFDITQSKGYDLLSRREVALCVRLKLRPPQYLEIKKVLIQESITNGLLESSNGRRTIVKIDVERRGNVLDFMVKAGWISSKLASTASKLQAPAAAE